MHKSGALKKSTSSAKGNLDPIDNIFAGKNSFTSNKPDYDKYLV
jgi:hypothetical protein